MKEPANVFLFSGQGSQYYHMGRELFESDTVFRKWMLSLDEVARAAGRPVIAHIYDDRRSRADPFEDIRFSHPAIFMVEFALAQALRARGIEPGFLVGVSLGSFAAAALSGCISPEAALRTVVRQADIVTTVCKPGGMIAVFADPALHRQPEIGAHSEIAAINFASHFVLAAPRESLGNIEKQLQLHGVLFQRLPVAFAFHSRWIDDARSQYVEFLKTLPLQPARIPILCCAEGGLLSELPADYFWRIARKPIAFARTINLFEQSGPHRYIDVGPSGSLATFMKYLLPATTSSEVLPTLSPFTRNLKNIDALAVKV